MLHFAMLLSLFCFFPIQCVGKCLKSLFEKYYFGNIILYRIFYMWVIPYGNRFSCGMGKLSGIDMRKGERDTAE